jgi:hypothetical protein
MWSREPSPQPLLRHLRGIADDFDSEMGEWLERNYERRRLWGSLPPTTVAPPSQPLRPRTLPFNGRPRVDQLPHASPPCTTNTDVSHAYQRILATVRRNVGIFDSVVQSYHPSCPSTPQSSTSHIRFWIARQGAVNERPPNVVAYPRRSRRYQRRSNRRRW